MNTTPEEAIQPMMNGSNEEVMKALLAMIGSSEVSGNVFRLYMSELWARGVNKAEFLRWKDSRSSTTETEPSSATSAE